jgi:hypothetical protein
MYNATSSNGEITNIKVVDLNGLYNFIVDYLLFWDQLLSQNYVWISKVLKFKFWITQTISDGEMTKVKVVDLDEF